MPRPTYCTPLDVLRRFNPQITQSQLTDAAEFIGSPDDVETIVARIEGVEDDFDRRAQPMREVRVGGGPGSYVYKSAKGKGFPIHVYLDHTHVVPFDPSAGDVIERRTGRDSWTDITNGEGSSWVADYRKGKITIYELPGRGHLPMLRRFRDRFIRLSYRYGAAGHDRRHGGQTTIESTLSQGTTPSSLTVANAARLPPSGGTMLVDGTEYVDVQSVDRDADTISIRSREVRRTQDAERASGSVIHYCPMDVREAIGAKAAREIVLYDDWTDQLIDTGSGPQPAPKLEEWNDEYENAIARYSDNFGYK